MSRQAIAADRIFDGEAWHVASALIVEDGTVSGIVGDSAAPAGIPVERLAPGHAIVPGLVDLQVNGGGGVQFDAAPTPETIGIICAAHLEMGTTALLPTLITSGDTTRDAALAAGAEATRRRLPGFLGLHFEGPHLSPARKGAHDPRLIRPMTEGDIAKLVDAAPPLQTLLVTLAPEAAAPAQIGALAAAGIIVSLGHSDCDGDAAQAGFAAGARMVTHLHNAMSPMTARGPGLVGTALADGAVWAGVIADGIHVHRTTLQATLAAKPGKVFLVSDAMAVAGTMLEGFPLGGRWVSRRDGALRLADGTLAGADLSLLDAVRFAHRVLDVPLGEALRMGSLYPAQAIGRADRHGHLRPGARADFIVLDDALDLRGVTVGGAGPD